MTIGKIVMNVVAKILNLSPLPVPHMSIMIDNEHQLYKFWCGPGYALSYGISTYAVASQHFLSLRKVGMSAHNIQPCMYIHMYFFLNKFTRLACGDQRQVV